MILYDDDELFLRRFSDVGNMFVLQLLEEKRLKTTTKLSQELFAAKNK